MVMQIIKDINDGMRNGQRGIITAQWLATAGLAGLISVLVVIVGFLFSSGLDNISMELRTGKQIRIRLSEQLQHTLGMVELLQETLRNQREHTKKLQEELIRLSNMISLHYRDTAILDERVKAVGKRCELIEKQVKKQ